MLKSNLLQPVAGTKGIQIYPYIRKIDLMSSNSYILSSAEQIALIDPGALPEQRDVLIDEIASIQGDPPRPIVIYLTHSHLDHSFQLESLARFRKLGTVIVAAHEIGAIALESQDAQLTLAGLLGKKMSSIPVGLRLLSGKDIASGGKRVVEIDGLKLECSTRSIRVQHGPVLHCQTVHLGDGEVLEIYSVPGHSPDSVCFRLGRLLLTGDIFFAPNPGMAGAYGWNQSDLLNSIQRMTWILEQKNILLCLSGHGRVLDADTAWSTLRSMYQDVLSLSGLEDITPQWARSTAVYAEDMMRELDRLFTIIITRLLYISHVLGELEEEGETECLKSRVDMEQIEELFSEFNRFVLELRAGRRLNWDLVHKAGQVIGKLESAFESRELGSVLDRSLLSRAQRMIDDYSVIYRGFRPTYFTKDTDINSLLRDVLEQILCKPYDEEAIFAAESYDDYLWALRSRIAHIDLFSCVDLDIQLCSGLPAVRMDRDRFSEALVDFMERLTGAGARSIKIDTSTIEGWVCLRITAAQSLYEDPIGEETFRFLEREFALSGGLIESHSSDGKSVVEVEFLPSHWF